MGNEPATGLEHLIPHNGGDFDIFAFGLQESTYDVKTEVLVAEEAKGTPQKRASMTENKELACVEILQSKLQSCLGDDFYLVCHAIVYDTFKIYRWIGLYIFMDAD